MAMRVRLLKNFPVRRNIKKPYFYKGLQPLMRDLSTFIFYCTAQKNRSAASGFSMDINLKHKR